MKASRVILLVGKACYKRFLTKLQNDPTLKLKMVPLKFTFTIFRNRTSFYAAYNSATGRLQHLIFYTPHASRFLQGGMMQESIYADLVWNTAAQVASIPIVSVTIFTGLCVVVNDQHVEKRLINLQKAWLVNAERGHPQVEKARQAHANNGRPGLQKAREKAQMVNVERGYPGLQQAWLVNAERGYPQLQKGRQTQADNGHPNLAKGRETQKENGYAHQKLAAAASKEHFLSIARSKLTTMLNSKEVCLLLSYKETELTLQECEKLYNQFATMFNTPTWDTYSARYKRSFNDRLVRAHQSFTKYKESPELFIELSYSARSQFLGRFAVWYSKEIPFGLPEDGISQFAINGFHYTVALFYRHGINETAGRLSFINYLTAVSRLTLLYFYITLIVYRNTKRLSRNLQEWKSSS